MPNGIPPEDMGARVRTLQIIVLALAMGVTMFGVVVVTGIGGNGEVADGNIMTLIAVTMAAMCMVFSQVVPRVMAAGSRRQIGTGTATGSTASDSEASSDRDQLAGVYQTKTIIACALLEGAAFFALVANMIEGQSICLALAGLLLLGILAHFPTRPRVEGWIDSQLRMIEDQRQFSS